MIKNFMMRKSAKSLYNLIRIHKYIQFDLTFIFFFVSFSLIWESQLLLFTKHDKKNKKRLLEDRFFVFYSIETIDTVKTEKKDREWNLQHTDQRNSRFKWRVELLAIASISYFKIFQTNSFSFIISLVL